MTRGAQQEPDTVASLVRSFRAACAPVSRLRAAARDVLAVVCDTADWHGWRVACEALLDDAARQRVQRLRNDAHRRDRAIAYALHRLLVAEVLGRDPMQVEVLRDARGCPFVAGLALSTSLSHGDDALAFALSWAGPVGVDIEAQTRAAAMSEVRAALLHPDDAQCDGNDPQRLLALWTRKEALLKAAGVGLEVPMTAFAAHEGIDLSLPADDGRAMRVATFSLPGRIIAVAHVAGPQALVLTLHPPTALRRTAASASGLQMDT